jgi:hypothetical protein
MYSIDFGEVVSKTFKGLIQLAGSWGRKRSPVDSTPIGTVV